MLRRFILVSVLLLLCAPYAGQSSEAYLLSDKLGITFISSIDTPHSEDRYARALELGAGWNRWALYWDRVETQRGRYQWTAYDNLLETDMSFGLRNNVILLGIPSHYREGNSIARLRAPIFSDGTDTPAPGKTINPDNPWAQFVYRAVSRYMPGGALAQERGWDADQGVRVWEIWNEPDYEMFWEGGVVAYARLLKVAYTVIHHVQDDPIVMVGGLLYPTQENFLAKLLDVYYDEPAPDHWYMDAVGIHNYGDAWRTGWLTLYVRQTLAEAGIERPIWVTESGVPVWDDYPGPIWWSTDPPDEWAYATQRQQAAFFIQSSAYAWAEGAHTVFFHQLYDDCGNSPPGTDFPPYGVCRAGETCFAEAFGIYRNSPQSVCFSQHPQPDSPRPIARAYNLLAQVFGEETFSRRGVVDETRSDGAITITFIRQETDERIVVLWNTRQTALDVQLGAQGNAATLYRLTDIWRLSPEDGVYRIELEPAELPQQRFIQPRSPIDIGGEPVILIERMTDPDEIAALEFATFESVTAPAVRTTAEAVTVNLFASAPPDNEIAALVNESPTGAVFSVSSNVRLRSAPSFENSETVGSLPFSASVPILGRTEDNQWLQLLYEGERVWVASFVGQIYGSAADIPIID